MAQEFASIIIPNTVTDDEHISSSQFVLCLAVYILIMGKKHTVHTAAGWGG